MTDTMATAKVAPPKKKTKKTEKVPTPKLTTEDMAKRTEDLCRQLTIAGMKAVPYLRPPLAPEVFAINLGSDVMRIWASSANIAVATDEKFRQAVLTVSEPAREVTRRVSFIANTSWNAKQINERAHRLFPVNIPNRRFKSVNVVKRTIAKSGAHYHTIYCDVTVTAPRSTQTFLVGMDEKRQFIAALPKNAKSVTEAHKILRPKGLPATALRQGEWFFIPATEKELLDIAKKGTSTIVKSAALEQASSHRAAEMTTVTTRSLVAGKSTETKVQYVRGTVRDTRLIRHAPLDLKDVWHRVIRNNEVVLPETRNQRTRMWD